LGSFHAHHENWTPFLPFQFTGVLKGVGTVFFSYIGFDSVSTLAGEVKKPSRDLPIGIVGTLLVASVIYVAIALVLTGMVNYTKLDTNAPLYQAFFSIGLNWAGYIIAVGSVSVMTATTLVSLVGQPRIFFQMAKDGLIFEIFGKASAKSGVPIYGTIITGVMSGGIALIFDINSLANMISIGTLLAFTVVCGGVVVLRYQTPDRPKLVPALLMSFFTASLLCSIAFTYGENLAPWSQIITGIIVIGTFIPLVFLKTASKPSTFSCPLVPFIPCLGILVNVWVIVQLPVDSIYRLLIWTFIGLLIYFFYGIRHSRLRRSAEMSPKDP